MSKVLRVVVLLIVALVVFIMTRPSQFHIERSTTIAAPPEVVYAKIADFHQWEEWSPWEHLDPNMKRTHSGAENGKGAAYAWEGDKNVGVGRMEITDVAPPSKVTIKLDFLKPFEGHNVAEFTLEPKGDATNVTWSMDGPMPFVSKVMCLFFNMDKMIGTDFEAGLANLKVLAEK